LSNPAKERGRFDLFYGNRFGEITGLVHISTEGNSGMIGKKLERNDV
jgi:hypothetical protein